MWRSAASKLAAFARAANEGDDVLPEPPLSPTIYAASAVVNILALALPLTILQIYDRVLPNASFDTLSALMIALVGVVIVDGLLKYLRSAVINWSAASFTHDLSVRGLTSMLSARPKWFARTTASEHLERLNAITGLGGQLGGQSRLIAIDVLFIPIFALVIVLIGKTIFFVVLALFGVFGYLALRRTKALNEAIAERESSDARKYDFIIEVLRSMQTVKALAMEPLMMRRFERLQSAASLITMRIIRLTGEAQTYSAMYASLSVIAIVSVGAMLVLKGQMTLGALACCMLLSSQLLQPLIRALASWNDIQLAKYRKERAALIFEDDAPEQSAPCDFHREAIPKKVVFKDAVIQYENAPPLFNGLNLTIPAGAMVAIKGADGSGRSSLLRAIMGDTPLVGGEIMIGDQADLSLTRADVRYVGQNPSIFSGTILENLTLFGEFSAGAALQAARTIGLDEDIGRMPLGYDTVLKSVSSRDAPPPTAQRITIARAIAMAPSVLILDEASTLLDLNGEYHLTQALKRLRGRMTIILATHRPSLIRLADKAYEVVSGKLVAASQAPHADQVAAS